MRNASGAWLDTLVDGRDDGTSIMATGASAVAALPAGFSEAGKAFVAGAGNASSRWILEVPDVVRATVTATKGLPEQAQATLIGAALVGSRPVDQIAPTIDAAMQAAPSSLDMPNRVRMAASALVGPRPAADVAATAKAVQGNVPIVWNDADKARAVGSALRSGIPVDQVDDVLHAAYMRAPVGDAVAALDDFDRSVMAVPEPPLAF